MYTSGTLNFVSFFSANDKPTCRTSLSDICDASVNNNEGCGVLFTESGSYGTEFNRNGGGYYVMSRSREYGIRVWFWSRNDTNIPLELAVGEAFLEEPLFPNCTWGEPAAAFPIDPDYCDYDQHFNMHMIMFSLTFCVWDFLPCLLILPGHN
jgi:hypothetical protein